MIKLSELKDEDMISVCSSNNYNGDLISKADLLDDLEYYINKSNEDDKFEIYSTTKYYANINAKDMLESAIENEYQSMYEDWDESISNDVEEQDIKDIQIVLDRILARNLSSNISYENDQLIEFDIEDIK